MASQDLSKNNPGKTFVCPESTIESANRRIFIKKAALATAGAGISGTLIGRRVIPESSANSNACTPVTTPCKNSEPYLAVWHNCYSITDAKCHGLARLTASVPGTLCVSPCCPPVSDLIGVGALCVSNYTCFDCLPVGVYSAVTRCYCPLPVLPTGVMGSSRGGIGVYGVATGLCSSPKGVYGYSCSPCGVGVQGESAAKGGVAIQGLAGNPSAIPIVARGASGQTANLQEWKSFTGTIYAVVNSAGSLGLGGVASPNHVLCISGKAHASAGFGIGTSCIYTTLAVHGSVSTKARVVTCTTTMTTTDFAILANAASHDITLTLPAANTPGACNGMIVMIKKTDSSTNTVTVMAASGNTIEGVPSKTLSKQYDFVQLISNGSNEWFVFGSAKCGAFFS